MGKKSHTEINITWAQTGVKKKKKKKKKKNEKKKKKKKKKKKEKKKPGALSKHAPAIS